MTPPTTRGITTRRSIDRAEFARKVRACRVSKGWNQATVAARMGVTPAAYSHLECGRRLPSLDLFLALCDALMESADELLRGVRR